MEHDVDGIEAKAVAFLRTWLTGDPDHGNAAGSYYAERLGRGRLFPDSELALVDYVARHFQPAETRIVELGHGFGELSLLLAMKGFPTIGYEVEAGRHAASVALARELAGELPAQCGPVFVHGSFPEAASPEHLTWPGQSVLVSGNVTSSRFIQNLRAIYQSLGRFDHLVLDLARFGQVRDDEALRMQVVAALSQQGFTEIARVHGAPGCDIRHFALSRVAAGSGSAAFDPIERFPLYFSRAGTVRLEACPVCDSHEIAELWRLPQSRLSGSTYLMAPGQVHNNTYLAYLPLLKVPHEIFVFDMCGHCHSIFRNPKDDDQETYKRDGSKVASYKREGLDPFRGTAAACEALFPSQTEIVVDAACGAGQVLAVLRENRPELKLFGLELSQPSVEWMKDLGIDAAVTDLDLEDLDRHVPPGSVDFILFNEAFEHVRSPLRVLRKLFRMLRVGGRIHFTAQYFGPDNGLQIRVGEPIYIDRHGLDWVIGQLPARLIDLKADIKYRATLEKVE